MGLVDRLFGRRKSAPSKSSERPKHPPGWVVKKAGDYKADERIVAARPIEMCGGIVKVGMVGKVLKTAQELGEDAVRCTFDGCEHFCDYVDLREEKIESLDDGDGARYISQPSVPARRDEKGWFDPKASKYRVVLRDGTELSGAWSGSTLSGFGREGRLSELRIEGREISAGDIAELHVFYRNRV